MTANKKSPTGGAAPKGAMPEMPEAAKIIYATRRNTASVRSGAELGGYVKERWYTDDQMRAMYLAGIAAARECVPEEAITDYLDPKQNHVAEGINHCRTETLANLSALEQGVGK